MRVLTIGRDLPIINQLIDQTDLKLVKSKPDVIVTHGGDGYLLQAERLYPGIPKLPIRHQSICKKCVDHDTSHLIKLLAKDQLRPREVIKLETVIDGKIYQAVNELSVYHQVPNQAIRFSVQVNDEEPVNMAIGDGVIIATPFGSHAYYRSITSSTFRVGIGIAYNNTTEAIDHSVVRENDSITIQILRGPAYVLADNDPEYASIDTGKKIEIKQSESKAVLLGLDHIRCPDCGQLEAVS